jgi:hypothetical protein
MKELIVIENTPAVISVNFDDLKKHSTALSEKYNNIVVTQETLPESKKLTTELNAIKNEIVSLRKSEAARATAPVKVFEAQMKELEAMWEKNRQEILGQVAKFEDETRKLASELLCAMRDELWQSQNIRPEFRWTEYESLAILSAVTATGNLTAGAKGKLEALVVTDKQMQDQTDMRLLRLENESYKSGLSAPLNRGHVEHFLFDSESGYSEKLAKLMKSELEREEVAQQRMREKLEREQQQKQDAEKAKAAQPVAVESQPVAKKPEAPRTAAKAGKVDVTVACTFTVNVSASISDDAIKAELRKAIAAAGITTLQTVSIHREQEAAA